MRVDPPQRVDEGKKPFMEEREASKPLEVKTKEGKPSPKTSFSPPERSRGEGFICGGIERSPYAGKNWDGARVWRDAEEWYLDETGFPPSTGIWGH